MQIDRDINAPFIVTNIEGNQQQYTINYLYEEMLCEAEKLFGSRNTNYKYLGIEHHDKGPRIWSPIENKLDEFTIRLNFKINNYSLCYQLAHETVHSLAPLRDIETNKFEEGIAVYFSELYVFKTLKLKWDERVMDYEYQEAFELVKPFIKKHKKWRRRIKAIRNQEKGLAFSHFNSTKLKRVFPSLMQSDIFKLKKIFKEADKTLSILR